MTKSGNNVSSRIFIDEGTRYGRKKLINGKPPGPDHNQTEAIEEVIKASLFSIRTEGPSGSTKLESGQNISFLE